MKQTKWLYNESADAALSRVLEIHGLKESRTPSVLPSIAVDEALQAQAPSSEAGAAGTYSPATLPKIEWPALFDTQQTISPSKKGR